MSKNSIKNERKMASLYVELLRKNNATNNVGTITKDIQTVDSSPKASSKNIAYEFADVIKKIGSLKLLHLRKHSTFTTKIGAISNLTLKMNSDFSSLESSKNLKNKYCLNLTL